MLFSMNQIWGCYLRYRCYFYFSDESMELCRFVVRQDCLLHLTRDIHNRIVRPSFGIHFRAPSPFRLRYHGVISGYPHISSTVPLESELSGRISCRYIDKCLIGMNWSDSSIYCSVFSILLYRNLLNFEKMYYLTQLSQAQVAVDRQQVDKVL